jgi:uncharacterized Zn-binding protein involved in type VI secretion
MGEQVTTDGSSIDSAASALSAGLGVARLADVFGDDDGWLFSDGVDRDFGNNKTVTLTNGQIILSAVQPLKCDPNECGLKLIGTIQITTPNVQIEGLAVTRPGEGEKA